MKKVFVALLIFSLIVFGIILFFPRKESIETIYKISMGDSYPTCTKYDGNMVIEGKTVTYTCAAPGSYIVGPINTTTDPWTVEYITTDSQNTKITYSAIVPIVETWE